jgi:membrane-associated protease RseP (regulator of RpoE activity)
MDIMTFATRSMLIFLVHVLILLLFSLFSAIAARLFRLPIREIGLFIGPRLFGFSLSDILFSVRLLPLGSFVRLDTPENDCLPTGVVQEVHPTFRATFQLAGPLGLLIIAIIMLGYRDAMHTFGSAYLLPYDVVRGAIGASTLFTTLFEAFGRFSFTRFVGAACAYYAAFNLYPIPNFPGGSALLAGIELIYPIPIRIRERLSQVGCFFVAFFLVALLFLFLKFALFTLHGTA